ncbi:MAG: DUF5916 domain-containing protein, partial [Bacteroidota bacterium]
MRLCPLAALLLLVAPSAGWAQAPMPPPDPPPLYIPALTAPIVLDGVPDEAAWQAVEPLPLTVYQPVYGAAPTERTEIRIAHDETHLYVAGHLYDTDPANIRVNSLYRDRYSGDDGFAVVLDPFDDNENALWFITTPAGVRLDWAVANDAVSSGRASAVNRDWNTFWDVATTITDQGWFAEMRIPFSSLGFQVVGDRVEMGLITYRFISRKAERHIYPSVSPDFSLGFAKPSQAHDVTMDGVTVQRPVYVAPYALGGTSRQVLVADDESHYTQEDDFSRELGLDVKYNLTANLTMDLTLNTDFAQVEADEQQVNLSRTSLFFPEKRQFFQERASVFEFFTGRRDRLFYSRRIGLEDGQPVRILGGARLVGRLGAWDVGLLNMQTARTSGLDLPTENFGVLRLRKQVLNPYSYVGGITTTRVDGDGGYNLAYGFDASLRPVGDEYVTIRWAQTFDRNADGSGLSSDLKNGMVRVQWERRREQGLIYQGTAKWYGDDFNPELGFVTRENIVALTADVGYGWFPSAESPFRLVVPRLAGVLVARNTDGSIETGRVTQRWSTQLKNSARLNASAGLSYEDLLEPLALPEDTEIPVGGYTFVRAEAQYQANRARRVRSNLGLSAGTFYDGWRADVSVGPTWNVSSLLEVSTEYALNVVRFPDRNQGFDAHIARLRIQGALNKQLSANTFVQVSSAGDLVSANLRVRYNLREG